VTIEAVDDDSACAGLPQRFQSLAVVINVEFVLSLAGAQALMSDSTSCVPPWVLIDGYRDNRRWHYYKRDRVLIGAHVGTRALRACDPVKIGKDGGKVNPSVYSSASQLRMKIVGRRRSIDEQRVRADLVYADGEAGHIRYYRANAIDKVVVKGGARDCGGESSDGRTSRLIKDVVTKRDV